jgi:putative adhesin
MKASPYLILTLPCLVLVAAGCASRAEPVNYDKAYPVEGRPIIHVHTNRGNVRVVTSDTKEVEFHVRYSGGGGFAGPPRFDSRQEGGLVELAADTGASFFTFGGNQRRMDIEVRMPKDADLRLESGDGAIDVTAVNGHVVIHTDDGEVRAAQLNGAIDISSNDGSIRVDQLKGDMKLHTHDGSIGGEHLDGKCEASSNDGSIHVDGRFDSLDVRSDDGAVVARVEPGSVPTSSWRVRTNDGSVSVTVPPDFKANLDASTSDGSIKLDPPVQVEGNLSNTHVQGALNGGGPPLVIHTNDGSVHLSTT